MPWGALNWQEGLWSIRVPEAATGLRPRSGRANVASDGKDNRRRFPRTPVHGEIVGQIYTETAAPVLDLSEGGALLEVPCVLRPRSLYTLRLALGGGAVLLIKASVVRSYVHHLETVAEGETRVRYHAALQFIDVGEPERGLLRLRIAGDSSLTGALGARVKPAETDLSTPYIEPADPPAPDPLLVGAWPHGEPAGPERRDSERVQVEGRIEGEVGLRLESRVLMLSEGGMTARMPFAPEIGSMVGCALEIDAQPVQVRAVVRDTHQEGIGGETPVHVVGLEFLDLSADIRSRIQAYVARRLQQAKGN